MQNQKLENLINLALSVTETERERSENLSTGYDPLTKTWELIVKYHGDLSALQGTVIVVEELIAGYAIVTLPELLIPDFTELDEIEYIEKPKRLFFSVLSGKRASCVTQLARSNNLTGRGVMVAVLDSGIDYTNPEFRQIDGSTRIEAIWDQSLPADEERGWYPPEGFRSFNCKAGSGSDTCSGKK
ncbi:MAG: hypothetical protein PHP50_10450 [Lachnospiraceae bacterium]|nr:hypothetical protein [Lachnospiraceae bacterium]